MYNPISPGPEALTGPIRSRQIQEIAPDVVRVPTIMVNTYLLGPSGARSGEWILVDAGLGKNAAGPILRAAHERFGAHSRPAAILLTHGHFDHIGALRTLADYWDVPIYAHPLELPYLTGQTAYPPADPRVGGGLMARLSWLYPHRPIDVRPHIRPLPADGRVPALPDWQWIHTPGHTPGHISLFRRRDRVLIAGDAFVTVRQESGRAVLMQSPEVHRPPAYFTSDWQLARNSVLRLADLEPEVAATGHGIPMIGEHLRNQLDQLAAHFEEIVPHQGRYFPVPARADEHGVYFVPPRPSARKTWFTLGLLAVATAALIWTRRTRSHA